MGLVLLILLIVLLMGGLPTWGYSRSWGYGPSGGLGLVLVIVLVLLFMGHIPLRLLTGYGCEKERARRPAHSSGHPVTKDCRGINGALAAQEQRVL